PVTLLILGAELSFSQRRRGAEKYLIFRCVAPGIPGALRLLQRLWDAVPVTIADFRCGAPKYL
ncbi:MAG TPA: hypothetical protein PKW80_09835, partial [Bacteroidales bacterium]|nr:hypothetical protein [Bacteroidales bacterium]